MMVGCLQELWLRLTSYNLYMHPFGSLTTNPEAYKQINKELNDKENNKPIWPFSELVIVKYQREASD